MIHKNDRFKQKHLLILSCTRTIFNSQSIWHYVQWFEAIFLPTALVRYPRTIKFNFLKLNLNSLKKI